MGLSIHYQGGINRIQDIPNLITELEDIAKSKNWDSQRINDDEPNPDFHGIIINPEGDCEPLPFIFDKNGKLRCLADLIINQVEPSEYSHYVATKTQYTTIETHIWIIGLLRYLKKHHLTNLQVEDEGHYWETENQELLKSKKDFLQNKINQFAKALKNTEPLPQNHTTEDIITQLEAIAKKLK